MRGGKRSERDRQNPSQSDTMRVTNAPDAPNKLTGLPRGSIENLALASGEELAELFASTTGMQPGFLQLSPGPLTLRARVLRLDGLTLVWFHSSGRQQWRDRVQAGALHFGLALRSAGPISSRGREISADEAQVWMPDREMDLVMQGPLLTLDIAVEPRLIEELGWRFTGEPIRAVPHRPLRRLVETCQRAFLFSAARGASCMALATDWRDRILDDLEAALQSWLIDSTSCTIQPFAGTRAFQILRHAEAVFESKADDDSLDVNWLATSLGIPRRTLFHAFRQALGLGPRRYFELKRLHDLRTRLQHRERPDLTVTEIATDLGFSDLNRLPKVYRAYFGENPSETLKRR